VDCSVVGLSSREDKIMDNKETMLRCDVRRIYKLKQGDSTLKEPRWVTVNVKEIREDERGDDVRCMHCHGAVRIHKQQVEHGPQDHAEHQHREDSESCIGGYYFRGNHKRSKHPIE